MPEGEYNRWVALMPRFSSSYPTGARPGANQPVQYNIYITSAALVAMDFPEHFLGEHSGPERGCLSYYP